MKGVKTLSTFLVLALTLGMISTASAQDADRWDAQYTTSDEIFSQLGDTTDFKKKNDGWFIVKDNTAAETAFSWGDIDAREIRFQEDYFVDSSDKVEIYETSSKSNKLGTLNDGQGNLTIDVTGISGNSVYTVWSNTDTTNDMGISNVYIDSGEIADNIEVDDYVDQFASDFAKPETLSCAVQFATLFSSCWSPFEFTFGGGDKQTFLNDLEANGGVIEEDRKDTLSNIETVNKQSFGISQAQAKKTAIEELNNGSTVAEARSVILDDVDNFWSAREQNLVTQHQLEIQQFKNVLSEADAIGVDYSEMFDQNHSDYTIYRENYTLINGTQTQIYEVYADSGQLIHSPIKTGGTGLDTAENGYQFLAADQYATGIDSVINQRQTAYDNVVTLVDGIYNNYQPGGLNPSDVLGPLEALKTSATNYAETGGTSYLATTFEQMGLSTSFDKAFTVSYQNTDMSNASTIEGQLFGSPDDFPNGFEANTTYDASSKTAWMVYQPESGAAESVNFNDTFTVDKIQNLQTGDQINNTTIQQQEFYTTNITKLESQLDTIRAQQEELKGSFGGGGGVNDGLLGLTGVLGGLVIVLILILAGAIFA